MKKLIKFEPIDLTHIAVTAMLALFIIYAFRGQLNNFFNSLQHRPITVRMSGAETTIKLDAPVTPEILSESIMNPQGNRSQVEHWERIVRDMNSIEGFQKLGFEDLYEKLSDLDGSQFAVINYAVDDPRKNYFRDEAMLKYLSIASEKIRYLAFYSNNRFEAVIAIEHVISGLASRKDEFRDFGEKIKSGQWRGFPHLITAESGFNHIPSVRELHGRLLNTNLQELPLIDDDRLTGFLGYKSITNELYAQISNS
jgi:hypothetical protein